MTSVLAGGRRSRRARSLFPRSAGGKGHFFPKCLLKVLSFTEYSFRSNCHPEAHPRRNERKPSVFRLIEVDRDAENHHRRPLMSQGVLTVLECTKTPCDVSLRKQSNKAANGLVC